jgi:cell division protein FtsL
MKSLKKEQERTRLAAQRFLGTFWQNHQQRPLFLSMGPVALCVTSVMLMGLMAVLYLSQVGQAVDTNRELEQIRQEQSSLTRQNQDLVELLAEEQSPGYIIKHAREQGLQPADPKNVHIIFIPDLQPIPDQP